MRFGQTLRKSVYQPWKDKYLEYGKLKSMLREDADDDRAWTEEDEHKFCEEILNVQLDKIASFQAATFKGLEERANKAGEKLRDLSPEDAKNKSEIATSRFKEVEEELDSIINETKELKKYSNLNFTGFLKIAKKHDRKRGNNYKIKPMVQLSLQKQSFNSESKYAPLLNKLSMMFFIVRQQLDENVDGASVTSEAQAEVQNGERYTAYKFWVHPDNLLEVKTYILRRLPTLVYSEQSAKSLEAQGDPTINSLYFDNQDFALYNKKVEQRSDASSVRIRWYGQFSANPDLVIEQKTLNENGSSEEKRFSIKEKYIQPFINGEYKMEKHVQKMERQGQPKAKIDDYVKTVTDIQTFIKEQKLQPVLRANYTRTAFQKPLDDKVRISIDSHVAFIREDALDADRPCRNPLSWHRLDIDNSSMVYPFPNINQGEISKFPFSILELKVKDDGNNKNPQWVDDLMASHLVHKAPKFSKFAHGVASLFEDHVNNLPFWLGELETDIRKDPQAAFDEEEERKAKRAEDEQVVGSYLGSKSRPSFKQTITSPVGKSYLSQRMSVDEELVRKKSDFGKKSNGKPKDDKDAETEANGAGSYGTLASVFPSFSLSKYAQARRERDVVLPPGVLKPTQLLKDSGPLQVEPKVWLANERTFLKWQHICILLGGLAVGLYSAAGEDFVAEFMGIAYIVIAVFAGAWGYYMHWTRRSMIVARSGKDFDNMIGPMVVSFALMVSLILNFFFKYNAAVARFNDHDNHNATTYHGGDFVDGKIELK